MSEQASKQNKQYKQPSQPNFRREMITWLIILLVLSLFYLPRLLSPSDMVDIAYSEFKQQVKDGNVAEVTIKGQEIRGTFRHEYTRTSEEERSKLVCGLNAY